MVKNKLKHFAEIENFPNVLQKNNEFKGRWNESVFKNSNPITLELACGKGEYTTGLAQAHPNRNFIGIDIKGARIYTGAKRAIDSKLDNVMFIRMQIDHLPDYFEPGEVNEAWITFPDPFPQLSNAKRRLTSPKYIEVYKKVLAPGSSINLKTDDDALYEFTLETIAEQKLNITYSNDDIYAAELYDQDLSIKTYYEKKHLVEGKKIKYVKFTL